MSFPGRAECTSDFNLADLEGFLVLDEVGCHRAILASVNRQLGEMLKLLSTLPLTKHAVDWEAGVPFRGFRLHGRRGGVW